MKIVVVSPASLDGIGGIEQLNRVLISEWRACGHSVTVLSKGNLLNNICSFLGGIRSCRDADIILIINTNLVGFLVSLFSKGKRLIQHNSDYSTDRWRKGIGRIASEIKILFAQHSDGVAVSPMVSRNIRNTKIVTIRNPISQIETVELVNRTIDILFVGRLVSEKGVDLLLQGISNIKQELKVVIVGSGPQSEMLQDLCCQLSLDRTVTFLGPMKHDEVLRMYWKSRVVVVPSYSETFGLVAGEALAANAILVASDAGNLGEDFYHPQLSFRSGNLADLILKLNFALSLQPEEASKINIKRKNLLRSPSDVAQSYLEYFQEFIS